ncbi:N-acetylglucosamine kinase [Bowmanella dokdonensis]|uniref:ATPase n=1 Tax=Bowmanella dokdonensis TaxID=751969 RepID=A0A939DKZ9_9ALTE|nr:BadF/BadG/BcrA/BcrD ATPase family protein [Bowmanella dokdonensis]MBN7824232.1 ATPase [Bowmanella dokdonensis]
MKTQETLYLGIDGGGSKCRVLLTDDKENRLASGIAGPANPNQGLDLAINSILDATQQALEQARLPAGYIDQLIVGIGLAGVNLPKYRLMLEQWDHPFKQMHITTDLHIACLGAHGGQDGAVIITGTGSCGMVQVNGTQIELGGHGFSVGDQGSGAWLGIKAVKLCLQSLDGLMPHSGLVPRLLELTQCNNAQQLAERMANLAPAGYARLAPLVLECAEAGDENALGIVRAGADYLNRLAYKLMSHQPPRLSMIGGLAQKIQPWLDADIRTLIQPAIQPPEIGAIHFAQQQV